MRFTHLILTGEDDDFNDFSGSKRQSPQLQNTVLGNDFFDSVGSHTMFNP
jgi:hypothetical protein